MSADPVFIDDGMTREGGVRSAPGLHGAVSFQFRPALAEERFDFLKGDDKDGPAYVERAGKLLARHVLDWDQGRPCREPATYRRLHPSILNQMLDQVLGYAAGEQAEAEKNSSAG